MPNAIVIASTDAAAAGMRAASPRTSATRSASPARAIFPRPTRSIAPAKSTPTTRAAAGRARIAAIARSAVPVQRSSTRSRPVSASDRIARLRHRVSMPALSRWFRKSYRAAIASNIPAMRAGDLEMSGTSAHVRAAGN